MTTGNKSIRQGSRHAARSTLVLTAAAALIASAGVPAEATYSSGGMPTRTFNYRTHGINPTWVSYFDTGNIRWNQRVNSHIGRSNSAAADATAGRYGQSWYGQHDPHGARNINRTFTIKINIELLSARAGSNLEKWILSTTTHELGHALSLADNPNVGDASIMKHDRNRTTSQLPTAYDIREVERIYR